MNILVSRATEDMPNSPQARHAVPYRRIAVIGCGAWGTALAVVAAGARREVILWGRNAATIDSIRTTHENKRHLPGVGLSASIQATTDLNAAICDAEVILLATPSTTIRAMSVRIAQLATMQQPIAICAKGIERKTGYLLSQVVAEAMPGHPIGAISGPTFARELALGHPSAAAVAFPFSEADRLMPEASVAARMAVTLGSEWFRPYVSDDVTGVEVGGAVKNVIAIACGMMTGAGFAENTRAALIARGLDEMKTLAEALGGRRETVTGLSGTGDLTLTCSSTTSRNMSLGVQLGQGIPRAACFDGKPVVVEGEANVISVIDLARRVGVSMPICEAVHAILCDGEDLRGTFAALWSRPIEGEPRALDLMLPHPMAGAQV